MTTFAFFILTGYDSIFAGLNRYLGEFYLVRAIVLGDLMSVFLLDSTLLNLSFA